MATSSNLRRSRNKARISFADDLVADGSAKHAEGSTQSNTSHEHAANKSDIASSIDNGHPSLVSDRSRTELYVACATAAVFALIAAYFDDSMSMDELFSIVMPLLCCTCLFYLLGQHVRQAWTTTQVITLFVTCVMADIGQRSWRKYGSSSPDSAMIFIVAIISLLAFNVKLNFEKGSLVLLTFISVRFMAYSVMPSLSMNARILSIFGSGMLGTLIGKYMSNASVIKSTDKNPIKPSNLSSSVKTTTNDNTQITEKICKELDFKMKMPVLDAAQFQDLTVDVNDISSRQHHRTVQFSPAVNASELRRLSLPVLPCRSCPPSPSSSIGSNVETVPVGVVVGVLKELLNTSSSADIAKNLGDVIDYFKPTVISNKLKFRSKSISILELERAARNLPYGYNFSRNGQENDGNLTFSPAVSRTTSASGMPIIKRESMPCSSVLHLQDSDSSSRFSGSSESIQDLGQPDSRRSSASFLSLGTVSEKPKFDIDTEQNEEQQPVDEQSESPDLTFRRRRSGVTHLSHSLTDPQGLDPSLFEISSHFIEVKAAGLLDIDRLSSWNYPIFDLAEKSPQHMLSLMAYAVFTELNYFQTFRIPVKEFFSYFHELEMGYHEKNEYHNRIHAADVFHAIYYMTTRPLPDHANPIATFTGEVSRSFYLEPNKILAKRFHPVELMALFTAAAMHDFDHPGRTNAFLVTTMHELAILYNNRAVLENHHSAMGWHLLLKPENRWTVNLDPQQFHCFRTFAVDAVLSTDLAHHFDILKFFAAKASAIDWDNSEKDRIVVSNTLIKMADINGPCKPLELHLKWTSRLIEEFYEQGDEEKKLGVPVSAYCDRTKGQIATLQSNFINNLVSPLCTALYEAGFLPGSVKIKNTSPDKDIRKDEWELDCEMFTNLEASCKMWAHREMEEVQMPSNDADKAQKSSAHSMKTITEHDCSGKETMESEDTERRNRTSSSCNRSEEKSESDASNVDSNAVSNADLDLKMNCENIS